MSYPNDPKGQDTKKHFHLEGFPKFKMSIRNLCNGLSFESFFTLNNLQ